MVSDRGVGMLIDLPENPQTPHHQRSTVQSHHQHVLTGSLSLKDCTDKTVVNVYKIYKNGIRKYKLISKDTIYLLENLLWSQRHNIRLSSIDGGGFVGFYVCCSHLNQVVFKNL